MQQFRAMHDNIIFHTKIIKIKTKNKAKELKWLMIMNAKGMLSHEWATSMYV